MEIWVVNLGEAFNVRQRSVAVTTTACHFCRRADFWPCLTCGVCQFTTHVKCYYRLGSDEAAYYETHSSDWRCQDCGGSQRHADCVLPSDGLIRHAGFRQPYGDHPALGGEGASAGAAMPDLSLIIGAAATKDRQLLRREKDLIDYDMTDSIDTDLMTFPKTNYAAVACPLPTTDMSLAAGGRGQEPLTLNLSAPADVSPGQDDMITHLDIFDSSMPRPPKQRQKGKKQANRNSCHVVMQRRR